MTTWNCHLCGNECDEEVFICPECGGSKQPPLPNYPTFGGPGVIKIIWFLFLSLVIVLLISMFTMQE